MSTASEDRGLPAAHLVVEQLLAAVPEGIAIVEESSEVEVRFANNTTTTNGRRRSRRVTLICLLPSSDGTGTSVGSASRSGAADLDDLVAAAQADAQSTPAANDASPLATGAADPFFEEPAPQTEPSVLRPVVEGLAAAFHRASSAGNVLAGFAEHHLDTVYLGTSAGVRRRHVQATGAINLVGRSSDGRRSAWVGHAGPELDAVSIESLEAHLAQRLEWARRTVTLEPGRYEVVLPPAAVADLMVALVDAASGPEAEEGRTVFSAGHGATRVGEQLATSPFELRSDPFEPGLECLPFLVAEASGPDVSVFDNGLPLARTTWITGGRLERLRYHRAGARRSGVAFTPPIDNLVLELDGARGTSEDLVASTDRGLLLTCLWYIREADPATLLLTGLTRDGVYLIERGEVVAAVNNFRFNESPVDLLARATEAGSPVRTLGREFGEWMNRTAMPALRIPDFNMSSTSAAS